VDEVKIHFKPIDVSAKTINGVIILNEKLIESGDWEDVMRYVVHEMVHVMQQEDGKVNGRVDKNRYLDDKNEQEAFQTQLEYMDDHESHENVQLYLEQLLDHHDIKGKERKEKIRILTKDL
jgi:Mlc titration factor MtfA (ptsG expression regulator)